MRRYFDWAGRTGVLLVTFVTTVAFLFVVFPNLPINGVMLDVMPEYSHAHVMAAMEGYGETGRMVYVWGSIVLDTIFPLAYVTFFAGLIYRFRVVDKTWWFAYFPVFAGVSDLAENVQIVAMLLGYPDLSPSQVERASFFTTVKGNVGLIYQLLGVGLLVIAGIRRVFRGARK